MKTAGTLIVLSLLALGCEALGGLALVAQNAVASFEVASWLARGILGERTCAALLITASAVAVGWLALVIGARPEAATE